MRRQNNVESLVGKRFTRLTVLSRAKSKKNGANSAAAWNCKCDCGGEVIRSTNALRGPGVHSCGCYMREVGKRNGERQIKHGYCVGMHSQKHKRVYGIWLHMKRRCTTNRERGYENYGGRGISVCDSWLDAGVFIDWALSHGYTDELTLERVDTNGDYCPGNCRWANMYEQQNNKRGTRRVLYKGEMVTVRFLADIARVPHDVMWHRVFSAGRTAEEALAVVYKKRVEQRKSIY